MPATLCCTKIPTRCCRSLQIFSISLRPGSRLPRRYPATILEKRGECIGISCRRDGCITTIRSILSDRGPNEQKRDEDNYETRHETKLPKGVCSRLLNNLFLRCIHLVFVRRPIAPNQRRKLYDNKRHYSGVRRGSQRA